MRFLTVVTPLALALGLVAAAPAGAPPASTNATTEYVFRTCVHPGQDASKEGLYLYGYHTGAGQNDATLGPKDYAIPGFINNNTLQFDLGTQFPWYLELSYEPYTQWSSVQVSVGPPTEGFAINDNKLVYTDVSFDGWLVCDWNHGVPQLFWKNSYAQKFPITSNCASVDLVAEKA